MRSSHFYKKQGIKTTTDMRPEMASDHIPDLVYGAVWHQMSTKLDPDAPLDILLTGKRAKVFFPVNLKVDKVEYSNDDRIPVAMNRSGRGSYIRSVIKSNLDLMGKITEVGLDSMNSSHQTNLICCHEAMKGSVVRRLDIKSNDAATRALLESEIMYVSEMNPVNRQIIIVDVPSRTVSPTAIRKVLRLSHEYRYKESESTEEGNYFIIEICMWILGGRSVMDLYKGSVWNLDFFFINKSGQSLLVNAGVLLESPDDGLIDRSTGIVAPKRKNDMSLMVKRFLEVISEFGRTPDISAKEDLYGDLTKDIVQTVFGTKKGTPIPSSQADTEIPSAESITKSVLGTPVYMESLTRTHPDGVPSSKIRLIKGLAESASTVESPWGGGTLKEFSESSDVDIQLTDKDNKLKIKGSVRDKSITSSALKSFDKKYIEKVLHKDVASCFTSLADKGVFIQGIESEITQDAGRKIETISAKLKPIDGSASVVKTVIPSIDSEGIMFINGTKYRMKKQLTDVPIKKTKHDEVMLSSYAGKVFINRCRLKASSYHDKLRKVIVTESLKNESLRIESRSVFDSGLKCPSLYSELSMHFSKISFEGYRLILSRSGDGEPENMEGLFWVGWYKEYPLYLDKNNRFIYMSNEPVECGYIHDVLNFIDHRKMPSDYIETKLLGKKVPVALVLGMYFGINDLIGILGGKAELIPVGPALEADSQSSVVTTKDYHIVTKRGSVESLVMSGLSKVKAIKHLTLEELSSPGSYGFMMREMGLTSNHESYAETIRDFFIDPMTARRLKKMNKPEIFRLLMVEACNMLRDRRHLHPSHREGFCLKGYERIAGFVYASLYKGIRSYVSNGHMKRRSIKINKLDAWSGIMTDKTVHLVDEINPLHHSKEVESYTMVGDGGRQKESLVESARVLHESSVGLVSEAGVDSGDAGINKYLPASPTLTSLTGESQEWNESKGAASIMSTAGMLSPFNDKDHPSRAMFSSVQSSHVMPISGAKQSIIRTGMNLAIVDKTSNIFIKKAIMSGRVTSRSPKHISVEYSDKSTINYSLTPKRSRSASLTIERKLDTLLKEGDEFEADDPIVFCSDYFEEDWVTPGGLTEKRARTAYVSLTETIETEDDSSSISDKFSKNMTTSIVEERSMVISFSQEISDARSIGENVDADSYLFTMLGVDDGSDLSDSDREAFDNIERSAPRAGSKGIVSDIDIIYNGDIPDMSLTIKKMVLASNKRRAGLYEEGEASWTDGKVDESYSTGGDTLEKNTIELKFFITRKIGADGGDKLIFGNQGKSVACDSRTYAIKTDEGREVEASYSASGFIRRVIGSAFMIGSTNTLCRMIAEEAVKVYKGKSND